MAHTVLHSSRHVPAGWLNWIRHSCSWSGHPRLKFRTLASVVQPRVTPVSRPREGCSTPVNGSLQLRHASSQTSASDFGGVSILNDWAKHSIFVSTSTDPFFNLSLEDMLFRRHDKTKPLLLIYRDTPCVVIGRNQTPYKEINLAELNRLKIPFIRRKSGGGTVFHDLGNTNYSIHLARTTFDRHVTAQVIVRALQRLGLDAGVNDRNDICIGTNKVSGSAYKIVNNRAYHHGTMLISTRLDTLGNVLRVNKDNLITKGVASVRSPVCNLQQHNPGIGHEEFTNAVIDEFRDEYSVRTEVCFVSDSKEILDEPDIRNGMVELQSWEVLYGQTPEFTHKLERQFPWGHVTLEIRSKHGIVLDCSVKHDDRTPGATLGCVATFASTLVGQRYGFFDIEKDSQHPKSDLIRKDLETWVREETC